MVENPMFNLLKWGASSQWSSSLYYPMWISNRMTNGKTHTTLYWNFRIAILENILYRPKQIITFEWNSAEKAIFSSLSCIYITFWLNFIFNYYGPSFIIVKKADIHFQLPKNKGWFITREVVENEIQPKSNKPNREA